MGRAPPRHLSDHADALHRQTLAAGPNSVDALKGLGVIVLIQDRPTEAQQIYVGAHRLAPQDAEVAAGAA